MVLKNASGQERESGSPAASVLLSPRGDVLLEPKLHPLRSRPEWVARGRLTGRLDQAASRLVLLAAPAGYGKTTLLAQWYAQAGPDRSIAWVSLDEDDNDPAALWRIMLAALNRACPTPGLALLLRAARGRFPDITGTLQPGLVNELAAHAGPVTIVLDDYDVITDRRCHEQIAFLLKNFPASAQIAISSRARPPLSLALMRARGDLTEVGSAELSLTPDEAAEVIRRLCGAELAAPDLAKLAERTEGWPAGVYLVALSLSAAADRDAFMRRYTGANRYVWEYLADEVINRQAPDVREFLLRTSVLDRFSAPLCEAVTGMTGAREIIDVLDSENVFLIPLDEQREWFRYHHLFAQALLSQLGQADPGAVPVLRIRASEWHRRHQSPGRAVHYALAAGDAEGAVAAIAENWYLYADSGRMPALAAWLAALGEEQIRAHPLAAHCAAWAAALSGDRRSAQRWLSVIDAAGPAGPLPDGMRSLEFSAALLRGTFGFGGIGPMTDSAERAVELEDDPESIWYTLARAASGAALYMSGEYALGKRRLEEALLNEPVLGRVRLLVLAFLALIAVEEGNGEQAEAYARAAGDVAAHPAYGLDAAPQGGLAHLAAGAVHASRGELVEARREMIAALAPRRHMPGLSPWPKLEILLRLAPVLRDLGDGAGAAAALAEARDVLAFFPDGVKVQYQRLERLEGQAGGEGRDRTAERLTARERAVLRCLGGPLSLSEIGREMYVSGNTIKSHTRAIYRKLGVSSRDEAVARGRDLGML